MWPSDEQSFLLASGIYANTKRNQLLINSESTAATQYESSMHDGLLLTQCHVAVHDAIHLPALNALKQLL